VSVAVLAAVFLSNIPEAIVSTGGLVRRFGTTDDGDLVVGRRGQRLAAGLGYASDEAPSGLSRDEASAGAILVMLTDEMIPGAHRKGHTAAGLATAFGFAVAALLSLST
jgi:ZIP family zinc transporter